MQKSTSEAWNSETQFIMICFISYLFHWFRRRFESKKILVGKRDRK